MFVHSRARTSVSLGGWIAKEGPQISQHQKKSCLSILLYCDPPPPNTQCLTMCERVTIVTQDWLKVAS